MDVLLIQPQFPRRIAMGQNRIGIMPPMMLHYLAKPLLEKGYSVDVLDLSVYQINAERLQEYVKTYRPKIVGITSATENIGVAIQTAGLVKKVLPQTVTVIGGPHVTFMTDETLEEEDVDFVVRGEDEIAFTQLTERTLNGMTSPLNSIPGLSYRKNGKMQHNPRTLIQDIDSLSIPNRGGINPSRYNLPYVIMSSRGCPFHCKFCAAAALAGGRYRMRSIENILIEIDLLVRSGVQSLVFADDTLTGFPERIVRLCHHIREQGYPIKWACESRVDVAALELMQWMAAAGCYTIQFGFESGSEEILKSMNKEITPAQIERAVALCVQCGITPSGNFMVGFPNDTPETIEETFQLAVKIRKMGAVCDLAALTPFPGTYYYKNAKKLGMTIHADRWDDYSLDTPIVSTRNLSLEEFQKIYTDKRNELNAINYSYSIQ